jgi:hypothetical protein
MRPDEMKQLSRLSEATRIVIDGKTSPDLVPDAIRMKIFFYRYANRGYAQALAEKISKEDAEILAAYSQIHAETLRQEDSEREKAYEAAMTRADSMNGIALAAEFESIYQQFQEAARKRYDKLLRRLSPEGERIVRMFAYDHVRPSMSLENQVAIAAKAPELYKKSVIEAYAASQQQQALTELPPTQPASIKPSSNAPHQVASESSSPSVKFQE